ncbi:hypothetical protein E5288_WYG014293 [Bos mutus]|uniref:Uncharacterized protein n=1 Tax=Bos mutus TaxID=72004 RepID=A0A6B0R8M3_9CETA|nr:hypothetical protein [Bos mutus]
MTWGRLAETGTDVLEHCEVTNPDEDDGEENPMCWGEESNRHGCSVSTKAPPFFSLSTKPGQTIAKSDECDESRTDDEPVGIQKEQDDFSPGTGDA